MPSVRSGRAGLGKSNLVRLMFISARRGWSSRLQSYSVLDRLAQWVRAIDFPKATGKPAWDFYSGGKWRTPHPLR
jgi:hypothetical protein